MAFKRILGGDDPLATSPRKFYILDMERIVLYDYCLPEQIQPVSLFASADDRFIAWKIVGENEVEGTYVLELASGRRAWIPNVEVLGWGEVHGGD